VILSQLSKFVMVTAPGAIVDNASLTTTSIDTKGFDYCDIFVLLGATDIAMAALKVSESDDDSSYTDITGADFSVSPATLPSASADNTAVHVGVDMRGRKRYLDVTATGGDGTAGAYITVIAFLSRAEQAPVTATNRGLGQSLIV
jgi:WD40 repeat protein